MLAEVVDVVSGRSDFFLQYMNQPLVDSPLASSPCALQCCPLVVRQPGSRASYVSPVLAIGWVVSSMPYLVGV